MKKKLFIPIGIFVIVVLAFIYKLIIWEIDSRKFHTSMKLIHEDLFYEYDSTPNTESYSDNDIQLIKSRTTDLMYLFEIDESYKLKNVKKANNCDYYTFVGNFNDIKIYFSCSVEQNPFLYIENQKNLIRVNSGQGLVSYLFGARVFISHLYDSNISYGVLRLTKEKTLNFSVSKVVRDNPVYARKM